LDLANANSFTPYKHYFFQATQSGEVLPRTLLHPRRRLHWPAIQYLDWQPYHDQQHAIVVPPPKRSFISLAHDRLEFRDTLPAEERSRLEACISHSHETLLAEAQYAAKVAKLPSFRPIQFKKREWAKRRTHGKANARGLTSAETSSRALKAKERREQATLNTPCPVEPSRRGYRDIRHSQSTTSTAALLTQLQFLSRHSGYPHLQRPRSFRRSGARSNASASVRSGRPTIRQGPQDYPH
jgi:hypothetical protein